MVSSSSDNVFDRLKDVINQRDSSIKEAPQIEDDGYYPDIILEENPVIIGDEKEDEEESPKKKKKNEKEKKKNPEQADELEKIYGKKVEPLKLHDLKLDFSSSKFKRDISKKKGKKSALPKKQIKKAEIVHVKNIVPKKISTKPNPPKMQDKKEDVLREVKEKVINSMSKFKAKSYEAPEQKIQAQKSISEDLIETGLDKLLHLIEKEGKISTEKASSALNISREHIEEWASILEDHNLIKIEYPIVGTIELIKKTQAPQS